MCGIQNVNSTENKSCICYKKKTPKGQYSEHLWCNPKWGMKRKEIEYLFFRSSFCFLLFNDINPKSLSHVDHTTLSFLHNFPLQTSFMPHKLPCRKQSGPTVMWKIVTEKLIFIRPASSILSSIHFRHAFNKTEVPWFNKCIGLGPLNNGQRYWALPMGSKCLTGTISLDFSNSQVRQVPSIVPFFRGFVFLKVKVTHVVSGEVQIPTWQPECGTHPFKPYSELPTIIKF